MTALELPYRVILSPLDAGTLAAPGRHVRAPRPHGAVAHEVTTAPMISGLKLRRKWEHLVARLRSWTPQFGVDEFLPLLEPPPKPFRMSLDPLDRAMLVRLMAGFTDTLPRQPYPPRASRARELQLSALGGALMWKGTGTNGPIGVDLEQWRHIRRSAAISTSASSIPASSERFRTRRH